MGYASQNLNFSSSILGIPKRFFGSAIIANPGKDGFEHSYFPIPSFAHLPFLVTINKLVQKARVDENNNVVSKDCINLCITMDNRFSDGQRIEALYKKVP